MAQRQNLPAPADAAVLQAFDTTLHSTEFDHVSDWIAFRRDRHRSPEASGQEHETSRVLCDRLTTLGISAAVSPRGVGVTGHLDLGSVDSSSPVIGVRADIDALCMPDDKRVSYASGRPGLVHACGHDVHTTVVLFTAQLLRSAAELWQQRNFPGVRVRFLFQAAEETCEGARWMIEDGFVNDLSTIIGLHVDPMLPVGQVGIRYGVLTAAVDEVEISIRGEGGHTARPHNTTDSIAAAAGLVTTLYQQLPRSVDCRKPSVFTLGMLRAGTASNVIPAEAKLAGTLRTTDPGTRTVLQQRIRTACESIAHLTGNHIDLQFEHPLDAVVNDDRVAGAFERAVRQSLGPGAVHRLTEPSMGGEDFAFYLEDGLPGAQIRLGCAGETSDGKPWPLLHSTLFDVDERCIAVGARVMARTVLLLGAGFGESA